MTSFYQDVEQKVNTTIINIEDFRKYHTNERNENDPMYLFTVKKLNNDRYEYFHETILKPRSKDGKIMCKHAADLWIVYDDSYEVLNSVKHSEHARKPVKEDVDYWVKEFEKPIEELYEYGNVVISSAYGLLIDYYRYNMIEQKYTRIYSKSDNFDDWLALLDKNRTLIQGEEVPFNIQMVTEKASTLIKTRI